MTDPINKPVHAEDAIYADMPPLPKDPAGESKRRNIEALASQQRREHNDLVEVTSTEAGQRVIMRILDKCTPYLSSFDRDPAVVMYKEGQRNVGLWLIRELQKMDLEGYANLLKLHAQREKKRLDEEASMQNAHPTV